MPLPGISGPRQDHSNLQALLTQAKAVKQDFNTLKTSLQNGDISSAQSAYADLQELILKATQTPQYQKAQASEKTTGLLASDFSALGQALSTGDITASQNAAKTLQQDVNQLTSTGLVNLQQKIQAAYAGYVANGASALPLDLKA